MVLWLFALCLPLAAAAEDWSVVEYDPWLGKDKDLNPSGKECGDFPLLDCLKAKAISLLDHLARKDVVPVDDAVSLVRDVDDVDDGGDDDGAYGKALTESDVMAYATREGDGTAGDKLNDLLFEKVADFIGNRSLKLEFPRMTGEEVARSIEEGRGKMKKTMGMFMMAGMMKAAMMIPIAIGVLFILAGKALIISKIALVLSLLVTLKKILAKPTEHVVHESHGWAGSGAGAPGWERRSTLGQKIAYNSYRW